MSDYNSKDIPTLDDIIDDTNDDSAELSELDDNADTELTEAHQSPPQTHTSLQIKYQETYNKQTSLIQEPSSAQDHRAESEQNTTTTLTPVLLTPIVDAVVAQLMPELEQQLKHSIKQALGEKLPEEIIRSSGDDDT